MTGPSATSRRARLLPSASRRKTPISCRPRPHHHRFRRRSLHLRLRIQSVEDGPADAAWTSDLRRRHSRRERNIRDRPEHPSLFPRQGTGYTGYLTGGWTGIGSGYPGAIGYMSPTDQNSVYIAPNMTFDFTEIQYQGKTAGNSAGPTGQRSSTLSPPMPQARPSSSGRYTTTARRPGTRRRILAQARRIPRKCIRTSSRTPLRPTTSS